MTGIHVGDTITASGGSYVVTPTDCGATSQLSRDPVKKLVVAGKTSPLFSHAVNTTGETQERSVQVPFSTEPFALSASVEPTAKTGQVKIRVRSSVQLKTPPQLRLSITGSTGAQTIAMGFDQDTASYTGTATLPVNTNASFEVNATSETNQTVNRFFSVALSPLNSNTDSQLFSSNGQLAVVVRKGALPADAIVALGPSTAPPLPLEPGMIVVSGPFSVTASQGNQMKAAGVVRFQLPNRLGATAVDGFDAKSFEIWRHNPEKKEWERLGGTLLDSVDVISLSTDRLGDYAVTARLLNAVAKKAGEAFAVIDAGLKPEQAANFGQCPITVKFTGYITTNGPGTVKYTFTRNDGATAPVFALEFDAAGTKPVNTTWTLGGPALMEYSGWERLKILSPNEFESSLESGSFKIACSK
jgi:hypothetical protein